ncbi:alpha/beta hydrolase [Alteromonas sp. CYL-A6]|uniref:alpha/beta hydrolase n=1 Tax=Alteromonas nitratireducens TaxID=3390813 RepID=UPI0034A801BF
MRIITLVSLCFLLLPSSLLAATLSEAESAFRQLYETEFGQLTRCTKTSLNRTAVCADVLRNEGNAPFILHHGKATDRVAVLVHGLSDSPFYLREIARVLHDKGFTVIVPLLPGHGLRDADEDMKDSELAARWQAHVSDVMAIATSLSDQVVAGGFSAGGTLVVNHYLNHPDDIDGILLFSGALALSDNAEGMAGIWGIKWLARLVDGDYVSHGPNPYKYPSVAGYAGLQLMDMISGIRAKFEEGKQITVPVFVAHSAADFTTPLHGVETLLAHSEGRNVSFIVDASYALCHADLVVNTLLLHDMGLNKSLYNTSEPCAMPQANPLFGQMIMMLQSFLDSNL